MAENEPGALTGLIPAAFAYAAQVATHGATTSAHMQGGLGFTAAVGHAFDQMWGIPVDRRPHPVVARGRGLFMADNCYQCSHSVSNC